EARMQEFYKHAPKDMVSQSDNSFLNWAFQSRFQRCVVEVFFDDKSFLQNLQSRALGWMSRFPNSMVLVVLDGHSTVGSGELVYVAPGKKRVNWREMPADVSRDAHRSRQGLKRS